MTTIDQALRDLVEQAVTAAVKRAFAEFRGELLAPPAAPQTEDRIYLSPKEVAARLRIAERTVRRAIAEGRLPVRRIGRIVRVAVADVERFASNPSNRGPQPPTSDQPETSGGMLIRLRTRASKEGT